MKRETSGAPPPQLLLIGCWDVPVSGLEEVSLPNSLTLFLVIIGSQVKHHPEQRRLALVFYLQLHLKWELAQLGKKKIPISPVSWGRKETLDPMVKVDPALGTVWQLSQGHLLYKSICCFFWSPRGGSVTLGFLSAREKHLQTYIRKGQVIAEVPSNLETPW